MKTITLTNTLFRRMPPTTVIFGDENFYYPDSNIHQTLIFEQHSENVYFYPFPTFRF